MSALRSFSFAALASLLVLCSAGCRHRANASAPPPPPAGATLVIDFAWVAAPGDNFGSSRTVVLSGHQVSQPSDSRYVSCFGPDQKNGACQFVNDFNATSAFPSGPEFDGNETVVNAQLGRWQVTALADSAGGATAAQTCVVEIDTSRTVNLKINLGVDAGCKVE